MTDARVPFRSDALRGAVERAERRPDVRVNEQRLDSSWEDKGVWLGDWGKFQEYDCWPEDEVPRVQARE